MKFLSLFSGIGGLDLGLERAGFTCVGQVEIDPYCRAVLAKHWPGVPRLDDVRVVRGDEFGPVDLVCGGVPCQPASCAGKRKGAGDERWLWGEFVRVVRGSGCTWFLAENVRGFLSLADAPGVVRELERAGFEVRTVLLGAHHVGAPHKRDRIWIVGRLDNSAGARHEPSQRKEPGQSKRRLRVPDVGCAGSVLAHPAIGGFGSDGLASGRAGHAHQRGAVVVDAEQPRRRAGSREQGDEGRAGSGRGESARGVQLADSQEPRREGHEPAWDSQARGRAAEHGQRWPSRPGEPQHEWEAPRLVYSGRVAGGGGDSIQGRRSKARVTAERAGAGGVAASGEPESGVGGAVAGLSRRVAGLARRSALRALGNAVVPQVAEVIGRAILGAAWPKPPPPSAPSS